jgi:hypothetical protein
MVLPQQAVQYLEQQTLVAVAVELVAQATTLRVLALREL